MSRVVDSRVQDSGPIEGVVAWSCWPSIVEECSVSRSGQGETKVCKWSQVRASPQVRCTSQPCGEKGRQDACPYIRRCRSLVSSSAAHVSFRVFIPPPGGSALNTADSCPHSCSFELLR